MDNGQTLVDIVAFVSSILLGEDGRANHTASPAIHYGRLEEAPAEAKLVVLPSGFLHSVLQGKGGWVPELPLADHEGLPVFFGNPGVESRGGRVVLQVDVIATVFFLLTRYEEILRPDARDQHGRFPGRDSLIGRAGLASRPIVDEYGALVRQLLRATGLNIPEPPCELRRVFLTHDMDAPLVWHRMRPVLGEFRRRMLRGDLRSALRPVLAYAGLQRSDPNDCFDWISSRARELQERLGEEKVHLLCFVMAGGTCPQDGNYEVGSRLIRKLLQTLMEDGAELGLHASYEAGIHPGLIGNEAQLLREASGAQIVSNRHHYLCWRNLEDYRAILAAGIERDFTMAFPDLAGFRLGTCRSFFWFDPVAMKSTELKIFPTAVMECSLDRKNNMNLCYEEALAACTSLIESTRRYNGDLTLLWHNTELTLASEARGSYQRKLYTRLLTDILS